MLTDEGASSAGAPGRGARGPLSRAGGEGRLAPAARGGRGGRRDGRRRRRRELTELVGKRGSGKLPRDATEQVKRVERRARTEALDLGLALCCGWFRDLAALAEGAPELALNRDRLERLADDAEGLAPERAREAVELVLDTRRRLEVNVSEELALEALWYRLADALNA